MFIRSLISAIPVLVTFFAVPSFAQSPRGLFTLTPQDNRVPASGGSGTVQVATSDQINSVWVGPATSDPSTVELLSGGTFVGDGSVSFAISANTSNVARSLSLQFAALGTTSTSPVPRPIADYAIQIIQAAATETQVFQDVPATDPAFDYINLFKMYGVTSGCSVTPSLYCPGAATTRAQVAAFVVRATVGENFPYTQTPYYSDVPPSYPLFPYIQKLTDLGISSGCGSGKFCPDSPMTRRAAAAFLIRAKFRGAIYAPETLHNSVVQYFADVPATDAAFPYVQKMKDLGITSGCTATEYCPDSTVTRGQIAVFMIRLFFTPLLTFS